MFPWLAHCALIRRVDYLEKQHRNAILCVTFLQPHLGLTLRPLPWCAFRLCFRFGRFSSIQRARYTCGLMVAGVRGVRDIGGRAPVPTAPRRENGPPSFVPEDSTWPPGLPVVSLGELSPPLAPVARIFCLGVLMKVTTLLSYQTVAVLLAANFGADRSSSCCLFDRRRLALYSRAFFRSTRTIARASPSRSPPRKQHRHKNGQQRRQRRGHQHREPTPRHLILSGQANQWLSPNPHPRGIPPRSPHPWRIGTILAMPMGVALAAKREGWWEQQQDRARTNPH